MKKQRIILIAGILFLSFAQGIAETTNHLVTGLRFKHITAKTDEILKNFPSQVVGIKMITVSPHIDGSLDDKCWENATKINNFKMLGSKTLPVEDDTTAYLIYDTKNIYIGFECKEKNMQKIQKHHLWTEGVEIFFDTNHDHQTAYHLGITPGGDIGKGTTSIPGTLSPFANMTKWDDEVEAKTLCGKDSWSAEIRIPFSSMKMNTPHSCDIWGICIGRSQPVSIYGSFPFLPGKRGFHAVEHYADLYFSGENGQEYALESISSDNPLGLGINKLKVKIRNYQNLPGIVVVKTELRSSSGKSSDSASIVKIAQNQEKEVSLELPVNSLADNYTISFSLTNPATGTKYYQASYPLILPEKLLKTSIPGKTFYMDENIIPVTLKIAAASELLKNSSIKIFLKNKATQAPINDGTINGVSSQSAIFDLNIAGLPAGEYEANINLKDNDREIAEETVSFEKIIGPFN